MMLSILQDSYGSEPERVLSVGGSEVPSIGDDEILVRVHAASIDRGTWHIMAGLPYPIRASAEGVSQVELPGVPLGSFQGSTYDEITVALHAGDLFVFCSDGVFEAMNNDGEEFGSERLIDVVTHVRNSPPRAVVDEIFTAVEAFREGASPNDDMTAVAVKITG